MASFLMIHGAWHGGWCFERLRMPLEARGHAMAAPDLPGMGGDARALAAATLDRWADFAIAQADALPGPVILCGHSRGGLVVSRAAERAPEAFAALVYVAALLCEDGRSLYDMMGEPQHGGFSNGLSPVADGLGVALSVQAAIPLFYSRCDPQVQAASAARLVAEPVRPLGTPVRVTPERFGRVPRHYVECIHDRVLPLATQRAMTAALPCASVTTLDSDHSPFLCIPDALAGALTTIAERTQA